MANNESLHKAKGAKQDEFYTTYEDIQNELNHYEKHFKNKTVLCNCDDPYESDFCKFFLRNFNHLGLKRLICTSYNTSPVAWRQMTIWDYLGEPLAAGNGHGYVMDVSEVPMANGRGVSDDDIEKLLKSKKRGVKKLNGDGDFRSEECIKYLKQADIVVTNPPFSLFREYVAQLIEYDKKFIIIGNVNAITYKEIFPLIKGNLLWLGASIHSGDRKFYVPNDYPLRAAGCGVDDDGRKYIRVKGVRWFTNLDYAKRHEELVLYKRYYGNEDEYPKYDNYDAINVNKVADIPCDYFEDVVKCCEENDEKDLTSTERNEKIPKGTGYRVQGTGYRVQGTGYRVQGTHVTGSWESRLPSSISTTRSSSSSLDSTDMFRIIQDMGIDLQSMDEKHTQGFSLRETCNGIMGVPITFLDKYNPEQFEIIGMTQRGCHDEALETRKYDDYWEMRPDGTKTGSSGSKTNGNPNLVMNDGKHNYFINEEGRIVQSCYQRILIKRRKNHGN